MLDLPTGYSFDDFRECYYFAREMIMDKSRAEESNPFPTFYVNCEYNPNNASEYERHEVEHGPAVAYFYRLTTYYPSMAYTSSEFEEIIAACEGMSSNIAELFYLDHSLSSQERSASIAATTHSMVFEILSRIFHQVFSLCSDAPCSDDEVRTSTIDRIKNNLNEIKKRSALIQFEDKNDELRILSRLKREFAIVAGRYSNTQSLKMVTIDRIKRIIQKERNRSTVYSPSFMTPHVKQWPTADIQQRGSAPGEWEFERLKPILKKQFDDINWDKY